MDKIIALLNEKGISTEEGIGYTGSKEKYISAVQRYLKSYEKNKKSIEDLLAASDMEGYCIKVHSLKSNSKMIGAMSLAAALEELEDASRNNDIDLVKEKTGPALKQYSEVIEILRPAGEAEAVMVAGELSAEEAKETAEKLLEALHDFDDDLSKEYVEKLLRYPFRITQKQKVKEAENFILDFMYDEASDLIREIIPSIE